MSLLQIGIKPFLIPRLTASVRLAACSLLKIELMWNFAVCSEMARRAAISLLPSPHTNEPKYFGFAGSQAFKQVFAGKIVVHVFIALIIHFHDRIILQEPVNRSGMKKHKPGFGGLQRQLHIFYICIS